MRVFLYFWTGQDYFKFSFLHDGSPLLVAGFCYISTWEDELLISLHDFLTLNV